MNYSFIVNNAKVRQILYSYNNYMEYFSKSISRFAGHESSLKKDQQGPAEGNRPNTDFGFKKLFGTGSSLGSSVRQARGVEWKKVQNTGFFNSIRP